MELSIARKTIEVERLVGQASAQALVHAEAMVPGAGREAVRPLLSDATLSLGTSEVQQDRVVLDGVVYCQAVYRQGDEENVRALTAQTALNQVLDIPMAEPGMILKVEGDVEHVEAAYENGHMVFRVSVVVRAQVLKLETVDLITQLAGMEGLETRFTEVRSCKLSAESGADTLLHEEVQLPGELDARMSLMDWYSIKIKKTAADLGGVRVSGDVLVEALIGTGVAGRPVALVKVALPFDQLVEMPEWLSGEATGSAQVRRLVTQVQEGEEGETSTLNIECELSVSAHATGQDSASALCDAYSTGTAALKTQTQTLDVSGGDAYVTANELFRGTLLLGEGAPGVGSVLAVRVTPSLSGWNVENGASTLEGVMEMSVLYLPGGGDKVSAAREELPFSIRIGEALPPDAWVRLYASGAEATSMLSDRMEVRCQVRVEASYRRQNAVEVVTDVAEDGVQSAREGVILVWPGEKDDLWSIGKRYKIGAARIRELNGDREKLVPGKAVVLR